MEENTNTVDIKQYKTVTENGVTVLVDKNHAFPTKTNTFYNPKMIVNRSLVMCTLGAALEQRDGSCAGQKIWECLDAFSATGLMALTWKRKFTDRIKVSLCDNNMIAVKCIQENCKLNDIMYKLNELSSYSCKYKELVDPLATGESTEFRRNISPISGKKSPVERSNNCDDYVTTNDVNIIHKDANVLLHECGYDFVHLDPYGTPVHYLQAAFRHIRNGGVVAITATDVAALYGKHQQVTLRNYGAYTVKCDCTKEIAVRLLLAAVAKSAALCNKGVKILASFCTEHFIFTAVQICRGSVFADKCVSQIQKALYCQMCREIVFIPNSHFPVDDTYSLLSCLCQSTMPGKTAVELGPMWSGDIYDTQFLGGMLGQHKRLDLNLSKLDDMLGLAYQESVCSREPVNPRGLSLSISSGLISTREGRDGVREADVDDTFTEESSSAVSFFINDGNNGGDSVSAETRKRKNAGEASANRKRQKLEFDVAPTMPPFYYHVQRLFSRCVKEGMKIKMPRVNRLIEYLHAEGYRASRTHFEPYAIRTAATLQQVKETMEKRCSSMKS